MKFAINCDDIKFLRRHFHGNIACQILDAFEMPDSLTEMPFSQIHTHLHVDSVRNSAMQQQLNPKMEPLWYSG